MAKLGVDYCNRIAGGGQGIAERKGGGADIHFTGAEWNLRPGCVGRAHSPMCCGSVFSWLCAHIGKTWCDRW